MPTTWLPWTINHAQSIALCRVYQIKGAIEWRNQIMTNANLPTASKLEETKQAHAQEIALLVQEDKRSFWRRPLFSATIVGLVLTLITVYLWQRQQRVNAMPSYSTETIAKGELVLTVTANGTLQPTRSVNIGSELSGTVALVLVDVNDVVKKGQVLVELDKSKLQDQVRRSDAVLAAALAAVS